jgi:hypothetical protein
VHGYKAQPGHKVAYVNENKILEERLLKRLDDASGDPRWIAIARSHIEQGFMAFNRAVFQPARLDLED